MYTRKSHDVGAYNREIFETTAQGRYFLEPTSSFHPRTCFQEPAEIHAGRGQYSISQPNDMANIESDLKNLIRKDTKDPMGQYPFIKRDYRQEPSLQTCQVNEDLSRSYPLLEAPVMKREQTIMEPRIDHEGLALDPQRLNRIRSNQYVGLNTRLYNRDTHVPKVPSMMDQSRLFPSGAMKKQDSWMSAFENTVPDLCKKGKEGGKCQ